MLGSVCNVLKVCKGPLHIVYAHVQFHALSIARLYAFAGSVGEDEAPVAEADSDGEADAEEEVTAEGGA